MLLNTLTPEREAELKPFSPHARFEIPSEKTGLEYLWWLETLISKWLTEVDKRNRWNRVSFDQQSGAEGGIGCIYLNGEYIIGCKLYWYDGTPSGTPWGYNKGCLLRDHEDKSTHTVHQIFLLTDGFAEYLKKQQIPFVLNVRRRSDRTEICRTKFTP